MICQKCNGTEFDNWSSKGAKFKTCLKCYQVYQITQSEELDSYREEAKLEREQSKKQIVVACPYCQSTNTKKITNTSKAVHIALFGIWSMCRNSKNYHCNSCGSDF